MANIRVRHTKFFKYLTIGAASLGVISSTTFAVAMGIDATNENFINDNLREYTVNFTNEGSLMVSHTYKRGEEIVPPEGASHSIDGEYTYFFIGWDITGNGLPDIVPPRAYYSFNAEACYLKTGPFDLSWLDISNLDLEQLLELMDKLNLDWEQLMDMFGIDLEQLMALLNKPVITFEADTSAYISYFRATSFGDFNFGTKKYNNPDFYDSKLIRSGSINPLSYTADKINSAYSMSGTLPESFDFVNYDITFLAPSEYYAVPDCEHNDGTNDIVDSDAHYVKVPDDLFYQTRAVYAPAMNDVINILKFVPFSSNVITKDERDYYKYALDHYTSIPKEYEEVIDGMIKENDWYEEDYGQVNNIAHYIEELGRCSLFNEAGELDLNYKKNNDPVFGLIENKAGSDQDFNTVAVMLFRRLNIPARMVKGYVVPCIEPGTNTISFLNQHWWCEIYVKNIGWMICDCMNAEDFLGMNPYGELDKETTAFQDNHELESIEVTPPTKLEYYVNESLDLNGASIVAKYSDDTTEDINIRGSGVSVTHDPFDTEGDYIVTVSYTENGVTKFDTFTVHVSEIPAELQDVEFNFDDVIKEFYVGETFNSNGIVAEAIYSDGTNETRIDVSDKVEIPNKPNMNVAGTPYVTARVQLKDTKGVNRIFQDQYQILIKEDTVVSMEVVVTPNDTSYYTGEDFDPAGLIVRITYDSGNSTEIPYSTVVSSITFDNTEFDSANPAQPITVIYTNVDGSTVETTFDVEVIKNEIVSMTPVNFIDEYEVGDIYDEGEFTGQGAAYIEATMTNGDKMTFPINPQTPGSNTDVTVPDLGTIGTTSSTATFEYDGETFNCDIPITVTPVNSEVFAVSPKVSTAGPGSGNISDDPMFDFNTTYVGTVYLRNASYDTYNPKTGWSNTAHVNNLGYNAPINQGMSTVNASAFVAEKASVTNVGYDIEISYPYGPMQYGLTPVYTGGGNGTFDEYYLNGTVEKDAVQAFTMTNFELTEDNINRLANGISFSDSTQANYDAYYQENGMGNPTGTFTTYLNDTSDAIDTVEDYINAFHSDFKNTTKYDIKDVKQRLRLVLAVKNALQSEFVYDSNFKYDSSIDPIVSFFNKGKGICNNFASASTMIYRHLGIPARFVVGFGANSLGGTTTVTAKKAHAWTEVWIPKVGWITVDCTGYESGDTISDMGGGEFNGDYGQGFGGGGIASVPTVVYGGEIEVEYDYACAGFTDGSEQGRGWYKVFDDQDNHLGAYSWRLTDPNAVIPEFLDVKVSFEWEVDGNMVPFEEYVTVNDKEQLVPKVDIGVYNLVPVLHVVDKASGEDVTDQYDFYLKDDTENMVYRIYPAYICVQVYLVNPEATYSVTEMGDSVILSEKLGTIKLVINNLEEGHPLEAIIDDLPSTVSITLYGKIVFNEDQAGNQLLVFVVWDGSTPLTTEQKNALNNNDYLTVVVEYKNSSSGEFNQDNITVIPIYGEVVIEP